MATLNIPPKILAAKLKSAADDSLGKASRLPQPPLKDSITNNQGRVMQRSASLVKAAVDYAKRGWAVLPLHSIKAGICTCHKGAECRSPGKHPIEPGGVQRATADVQEVTRLWDLYPGANIGVATGAASGIVAIDVDPRNGGRESSRSLAADLGQPPRTPYSDTGGGGYHRLFCYPEPPIRTRHDIPGLPGIDVQSDGAYIVAPPSFHASGERYTWREGRSPSDVSLASLSAAWLDRFQATPQPVMAPNSLPMSSKILEGGRNAHLTSKAGLMRQRGLSNEDILVLLTHENTAHCKPPLDDDEVASIAASVCRYPLGPAASGDEAESIMQTVLDQHYAGGVHLIRPEDGKFWAYDGTRWAPRNENTLSGLILKAITAVPARRGQKSAPLMGQVLSLIKARVAAEGDPLRFQASPHPVINCRNGELWIGPNGSVELRAHDPKSGLRHLFEVVYDPEANCPQFDAARSAIFAKASKPTAMVDFWDELMGYAMQSDRRVPLVVLGWGKGNNGKTRLIETFTRLVGHDVIMATPIGSIEKNRFSTGHLLGKLAIIDDDVKSGTRLPDGELKRLSEEKVITGEQKYGSPFQFICRTAILMLFNNPPSLADLSWGMQRRIVVVPFDRMFTPEETDPGLFQRIWATEMPGVLNRFLAGLQRVIRRDWKFDPPETALQAKEKLLQAANPLPAFVEECCELSGTITVQSLYDAYNDWAKKAGITIVQQRIVFQRNLESLGFRVSRASAGYKVNNLSLKSQPRSPWP